MNSRSILCILLAPACLGLGACSALLAGPEELPHDSPALSSMEEPFDLQAEPQDEPARQLLPAGSFSGIYVADARASLDAMLDAPQGVAVERVVENSPGDAAGIEEGDLLLSVRSGDGAATELRWPSEWRAIELAQAPGSEIEILYDRAGAERTARVVLAPRVRSAERTPAVRLREELRVGAVLRSASEVEARAAGLAPGAGAVVVGLAAESPWRAAGMRFEDLILAVDDVPVAHPQVVLDLVRSAEPGATLRVSIARGAERLEIEAPTSRRERETKRVYVPLLFSYERERGESETSILLGLIRFRKTAAAWDGRLLWFISFGGGDADKLEPVRY
ncbi:MAG: PDZ domain-containing protein [Planctomycetota bacterium]